MAVEKWQHNNCSGIAPVALYQRSGTMVTEAEQSLCNVSSGTMSVNQQPPSRVLVVCRGVVGVVPGSIFYGAVMGKAGSWKGGSYGSMLSGEASSA